MMMMTTVSDSKPTFSKKYIAKWNEIIKNKNKK